MKLSSTQQWLVIIAMLALSAGIYGCVLTPGNNPSSLGGVITPEQFQQNLGNAHDVAVVMDLSYTARGNASDKLMQCGVDLAQSLALVGKNVTPYAIDPDGKTCYTGNRTTTADLCATEYGKLFVFRLSIGPNNSTLRERGAEIQVNQNYAGTCRVDAVNNAPAINASG